MLGDWQRDKVVVIRVRVRVSSQLGVSQKARNSNEYHRSPIVIMCKSHSGGNQDGYGRGVSVVRLLTTCNYDQSRKTYLLCGFKRPTPEDDCSSFRQTGQVVSMALAYKQRS
jgi:hypothetical protein